jgi:UDP-N-acetylglucosamine 2-epimerase
MHHVTTPLHTTMKLVTIVGTRVQFIKGAMVNRAINSCPHFFSLPLTISR